MSNWKFVKRWHVATICLDCLEDVLRQTDGVEPEISLEQEIDYVVDAPFPRISNISSRFHQ